MLAPRYCSQHFETFTRQGPGGYMELQEGMHLPAEIGEKLFHISQTEGLDLTDKFVHIFKVVQEI